MIHETAIVHPAAEIGEGVEIGPYSVIGENVKIGNGCYIGPHVVIEGWTTLGENNRVFQFASVGAQPQDLKFAGEKSELIIGSGNTIRESVTLHRGTSGGGGVTRIGDNNLFMAYVHVGHDCHIGNFCVFANVATLAGHVVVEDYAILGGVCAVHQFTRIGAHVMASGGSMIAKDLPPYTMAQGDRARVMGINVTGLKRRGFSAETISVIKKVYKLYYRSGLLAEEALTEIENLFGDIKEAMAFCGFIKASERGVTR
ncbi:acyl-ACP--UDP-N-acetylglucosamine O-acyltransferase [Desulforhopalus singaporensis]|uniref:Acyl-[acyl-carrier-protein]--UDP-N-acetylglucosamine O-acyltransferase n=1 Tax=Desulforhopalus singaporensis TaxID=91360 RepID=A0A1H0J3V0_9BACT|nr:acyl-ACP--UDP-N-acetylglucosamine O-acyltransferase [Desulforhopalus singaporensis]SDO38437.1 acyl-[acyl-carrier-protein]--UDP-N-acetylglucosamine O-acyltransferase [Desulforhopalus singaporensis]